MAAPYRVVLTETQRAELRTLVGRDTAPIAVTKAESAVGAKHHCSLRCGLTTLFEGAMHRLIGESVHDFQADRLIGEQAQTPTGAAVKCSRADCGDEVSFLAPVEHPRSGRFRTRPLIAQIQVSIGADLFE